MKFEYKEDHIRKPEEDFAGLRSLKKKKIPPDGFANPSERIWQILPTDSFWRGEQLEHLFEIFWDLFKTNSVDSFHKFWVFLSFSFLSKKHYFPSPKPAVPCLFKGLRASGSKNSKHGKSLDRRDLQTTRSGKLISCPGLRFPQFQPFREILELLR